MTPQRISAKFFVEREPGERVNVDPFIALFHSFIQKGGVEGLLIDVADYAHVPDGPGVILIGHEVDYGIDLGEGGPGLLTTRKRYGDAPLDEMLVDTLRKALIALRAIEADGSTGLRFATDAVQIRFIDRLAAPNTREAFDALLPEIEPGLRALFGESCRVEQADDGDERSTLGVRVIADQAVAAEKLLERLGAVSPQPLPDAEISAEELKRLLDQGARVALIDVREPHEYDICNLGAELIPLGQLADKLDGLDRQAPVVVHCRSGPRGARAVELMRGAGFQSVRNLTGGILAWIERVDPSLTRY